MVQVRAKAAGYPSAVNVGETNQYIGNKVNAEMANLAAAFEAAMDDRAPDSGATASLVGSNETAANLADKRTSNNQDAILVALKSISNRLDKVKKGGCGRRRRGCGRCTRTRTPRLRVKKASPA